ncbi:MAG: hypothetical protein HXY53_01695 [Nitrospirae bacterium]|nr:hypothetical protein [Nitrospirota bacterium]
MNSLIPFICMGLTSLLLQITALRLLLSTFSGNELDIGITFSFWLIYVSLGSYIGQRIRFKYAFIYSFIVIAILSLPTAFAIKSIRTILYLEPGESVSFHFTVLSTAITLLPLCFMIGLQFPLSVSFSGGNNAAGRVYGLEAFGAFTGGILFTFFISSRMNAFELCLVLSLINIVVAVYLSKKKLISITMILPLIFYIGFHKTFSSLSWNGMEISQSAESRYGEIEVIKIREQSSIYTNGHLMFTYPNPQRDEMNAHLPMTLHPSPSNILVIGGSLGILKEFLKYPVDSLDFIELDSKIVEISMQLLNSSREDANAIKDQRVRIIIEDGRRFIKKLNRHAYDLIILNLPQPSTASINRFYTTDFFMETKDVLKRYGMIYLSIPQSTGYIGKRMKIANGSIYNSLKSVFRYVEVTTQEYGGLFASDSVISTEPEILEKRFIQRAIHTKHFNQYIFSDVFSPFNLEYVKKRLGEIKLINTDFRPSAYVYNLMLWAEIHGGGILYNLLSIRFWNILIIFAVYLTCIALISYRKKKRVIFFSIFTTGFSGMSFVLTIILTYQAIYGYIYEMIGILSATFMIGLWIGTLITRNLREPLRILFYMELTTILLSVSSPLLFFKSEFLFYILVFLIGAITGGQFSTANLSMGSSKAGGKLYAMDLIGSFTGSLLSTLLIIPLFGISSALMLIAFIKAFSAFLIRSIYTESFN